MIFLKVLQLSVLLVTLGFLSFPLLVFGRYLGCDKGVNAVMDWYDRQFVRLDRDY